MICIPNNRGINGAHNLTIKYCIPIKTCTPLKWPLGRNIKTKCDTGAHNLKGDTESDSSTCHILYTHTIFEGYNIRCYTGIKAQGPYSTTQYLDKMTLDLSKGWVFLLKFFLHLVFMRQKLGMLGFIKSY